jgi:hypothetical protein
VSAASARRLAVALLVVGPILGTLAARLAGLSLALLALTAATYDVAGRGRWLGPTLLGLCRAGNLASGVLGGAALSGVELEAVPDWAWLACALYGLYVFFASRLARLEDDEDDSALGMRPTLALLGAAACLAVLPWTLALSAWPPVSRHPQPGVGFAVAGAAWVFVLAPAVLLSFVSAALLVGVLRHAVPWTRALVGRTAGMCLRRLLVFTSVVAWCAPIAAAGSGVHLVEGSARAWIVSPLLLLGYPIALRLRRVFPPT